MTEGWAVGARDVKRKATDTRRDPRRIGIGASCLVGVYAVVIFIDESTAFRLVFGAICTAMALALNPNQRHQPVPGPAESALQEAALGPVSPVRVRRL